MVQNEHLKIEKEMSKPAKKKRKRKKPSDEQKIQMMVAAGEYEYLEEKAKASDD